MEREEKRWGEQNFLLYFRKCKCIIFKYFKYWIHIVIIFFWIPAVTEWFNLTGSLRNV